MRSLRLQLGVVLILVFEWLVPPGTAGPQTAAAAPAVRQLLPAWFAARQGESPASPTALPAWFTAQRGENLTPPTALPAWFGSAPAPIAPLTSDEQPAASDHHTIYPSAVTITGPEVPINNCDVVTFTIVAANDAVTTTGVLITSTMPAGFEPTQVVFDIGEVGPNEVITRHAVFSATCSAVSGQNVVTLTQDGYDPIVRYTDFVVNPGAITVRKEPAVIPAAPGDVVTWTVYVENTGYGAVSSVRVTDTLGSGLEYVSGITSTSYISLAVGQVVTFPIAARVVGCSGLENVVTATWGCNGQTCQAPQTAKGAVDLQMTNPDLDYTLPSFDVGYCAGSGVFTIPITNNGDGTAYSGTLTVDLSPFSMTVAPPASYDGSAFHLPDILPGQTYNLVFTLTVPAAVCTMPRSGAFSFNLTYYDRCGNPYTEMPQSASWQLSNTPGQLSVEKSMPGEVYRGENVTATVTVNAAGIVGSIIVTDQVPAGWSVVDADGGTIQGDLIIWVLTGSAVLNPVFATPDAATGCAYCGTAATNIVTATATDCQNCQQTATDQATTYLQCEEPVATTSKRVSGPAEVCTDPAYTYTNTYAFADTFIVTPTWQGMIFTETLPHQTYVTGSASVWMSDGAQTCTATFSAGVVGGMLVISNISPTCAIAVPGATMWISYRTAVAEPAACSDFEWYDWSVLNLGVMGNAECAADGVIEEGVFVRTLAPAMTLSLSGLPPWVSPCGVYTVTLTAQRTSAVPAYDAALDVPTSTFAVIEVLGFSSATPAYTTTDALGYHWYYSDTFATATTGTVQLRVQLRCGSGAAPFQGTLYYDNRCADNDTYRERCSTGGNLGSPPVIQPLPIMTKFPEVIYAHGDVVTWTLIAYNSGAGPAYSVVLTDALGSGLRYVDSSITSTQGSVAGVTPITSSNRVTWVLPVMQPKERVTIQYVAEIIGCDDLTNRFAGMQGCLGQTCQSGGPVVSRVEIPPAILLNTNQAVTPIETCYTRTVTVTVRNAGLLSVYSATLTETLPVGLQYVTNTTEVSTDTVNWQPGPNPTIAGQSLHWGPGSGAPLDTWLSRLHPGETVYLRYNVYASCPFEGGQLRIQTGYRDTCGNPYLTEASYFVMPVRQATLNLEKTGQNLSRTSPAPDLVYAEPGEPVVFTLTLSNAGSAAPAHEVVVTDTLPGNVVFQDASPGYGGPAPGSLGGVITWALDVITPATTVVLTITTVVSQPEGCTVADTYNIAEAAWGCPDGCRQGARTDRVTLRTRPVYDTPIIQTNIPPATLHRCGGEITVTLNNQGPPAYNVTLTDTLPSGYVYSGTVWASTPPSGTVDLGGTVVFTWGVLPTGPTVIVIAVRNSVGAGGCAFPSGPNVITMTYDDDVEDCYNTASYSATATTNINVVGPNLVVDKSPATLTAQVGQRVTWTLTVRNTGTGAAYNVVVTDVVDSTFTNITATFGSDGAPPVIAGNIITWVLSQPISASGVWTAQVSAVVTETGVNLNVVTATASCDTGCLLASASDVAYVTLLQQFGKGPEIQTGTIGSLVVFTFTASLADADALYENLTLTDTLPTGLGYVSSVLTYTYDADGSSGGPFQVISTTPTITPGYLASGNVVWRLGNLSGSVQINGVLTAVIQNITSNLDGVRRTNTLRLSYVDAGQSYAYTDTANVDILEPLLHIGKSYLTPYGCNATLLQDNFNDGDAAGWVAGNGTWNVVQGEYRTSSGGATRLNGNPAWTDYSFSAMLRGDATGTARSRPGLYVRYTDANNYVLLYWSTDANLRLRQRVGAVNTDSNLAYAFTPGTWYHVEVQVVGNLVRVWVNGVLRFNTPINAALAAGRVGLYNAAAGGTGTAVARFDDVLVTRLGDQSCYVGANDLVTYTLTVSNQAPLPAYDLVITDVLPAGMSLVTYTMQSDDPTAQVVAQPSPIPGATGILTWGVNHLTPTVPYTWGQHTAITLNVVLQVSDGVTANTVLSDQAFLAYDNWEDESQPVGIDRDYSGGSHSAAVQTADGGILKSVTPPTATLGNVITYVIAVPATPITATLYNVTVTDQLDGRLQLHTVTDGPGGSVVTAGNAFTVTYTSIPAGGQRFITVTAVLSDPLGAVAGDVITNLAVLRHQDSGPTPSNQPVFTVTEPSLTLVKASDPPTSSTVRAGEPVTYTARITNGSGLTASPAYDLVFTDTLPVGMRATPPALLAVTLNGAPVAATDYATGYDGTTGVFTVAFTPAFSIPVGGELVVQYVATVDSDAPAATDLPNRAEVTWSSLPGPVPGDRAYGPVADTATVHTPLAVGLTKAGTPPTVTVGSQVVFSVVLPVPPVGAVLHNVVFTDVVDSRLRIDAVGVVGQADSLSYSGQVVTATFTTIPTYTQETIVITATVRDLVTVTAGTQITNAAAFDYRYNPNGPISSNEVTVTVAEPLVTLEKSVQVPRDPLGAGDIVTYTLVLSNTGTWPAYDLVVTDSLPTGLNFVATVGFTVTDPTTATLGRDYPAWTVSQLNVGGYVTITFTAQVAWDIGAGLVLTNAAWGRYDGQPGPNPDERTYPIPTDTVPVNTGYPALDLEKSAEPSPVEAGGLLTYTLTVINTGIVSATGVAITDTVPINTLFVTATLPHAGPDASNVITWPLGVLDIGVPRVVTMVVQVDPSLSSGALITNSGWVTSTEGLTDTDTVTTPVVTSADLAVVKADDPDPVVVGTLLTYTLAVINNGPSVAQSVVVTDTLPPEVEFVSATPTQDSGPNPLVWSLGDLAVGETRQLTVTVRVLVTTTDVFTNVVSVGSETPDSNSDNNTDEETTTPLVPGLELTKDVAPGEAVRNMPFTYTIRITNTGQVTFDPLVLTDTLPADFYYIVGSGSPSDPDTITEPLLVWQNLGPLAPGQSITVTFAVTATPGVTGTYWNVALVGGEYPGGVLTDTDDAPVAIVDPLIALDKRLVAADMDEVQPNYVTFTIVITNVGVSTIDVLPLVDQYDPYYLSFVTATTYPDEPADDGLLTWYDLTGPAPNGFGQDLPPGASFRITTVFSVVHDITTTVNTAIVTGPIDVYNNPANEPRDSEPIQNVPTAVELLYFRVGSVAGQSVRLEWATAVEIGTFGFNLYRAPVADFARATAVAFVPSEARGSGATYVYTDTVPADGVWWYWLAEVDTSGQETVYGPVSAGVGAAAFPYRLYLPMVMRDNSAVH